MGPGLPGMDNLSIPCPRGGGAAPWVPSWGETVVYLGFRPLWVPMGTNPKSQTRSSLWLAQGPWPPAGGRYTREKARRG